jgi:hypothetical protein
MTHSHTATVCGPATLANLLSDPNVWRQALA